MIAEAAIIVVRGDVAGGGNLRAVFDITAVDGNVADDGRGRGEHEALRASVIIFCGHVGYVLLKVRVARQDCFVWAFLSNSACAVYDGGRWGG